MDGPELPQLCVRWWEMKGRVKEPENGHLSFSGHIQVKRSVINIQGTALAVLLLIQLQNLLKEEKMVQFTINQMFSYC